MTYDDRLADEIRAHLARRDDVTEKRMFGGLAFMIGGKMAVAANRAGGLMVRVDPDDAPALLEEPGVERMVMGGRQMKGWLRLSTDGRGEDEIDAWVDRGVAFAETLT